MLARDFGVSALGFRKGSCLGSEIWAARPRISCFGLAFTAFASGVLGIQGV